MNWNEHDATIISLQASLMNAQVRLDELAADNDDLNSELEDLEEQLYEKYEQLGDIDRNRTQHLVTAILARITRRILIVKCQDQVSSGKIQWQTRIFTEHAETVGLTLIDSLHVVGHRKQPANRQQCHARRDYSTGLVFSK